MLHNVLLGHKVTYNQGRTQGGGVLGVQTPPIGPSTKMHFLRKNYVFSTSEPVFFAMTWTPTRFKATFETFKSFFGEGGVNLSKIKLTNQ